MPSIRAFFSPPVCAPASCPGPLVTRGMAGSRTWDLPRCSWRGEPNLSQLETPLSRTQSSCSVVAGRRRGWSSEAFSSRDSLIPRAAALSSFLVKRPKHCAPSSCRVEQAHFWGLLESAAFLPLTARVAASYPHSSQRPEQSLTINVPLPHATLCVCPMSVSSSQPKSGTTWLGRLVPQLALDLCGSENNLW